MTATDGPLPRRVGTILATLVAISFISGAPILSLAEATSSASISISAKQTTNDNVEAMVRAYFADTPVMIAIAQCESGFTQFDNDGQPLHGGNGGMIGVFQEAASLHAGLAQSLGMDIYTVEGNLAYARQLYIEQGTVPWNASKNCWLPKIKALEQIAASANPVPLQSTLKIGTISPEVITLQKILNKNGFPITQDGPGSIGQETAKFGTMTKLALQKFQCAKNIVCSGDESTTGYGAVGPTTRTALTSLSNLSSL